MPINSISTTNKEIDPMFIDFDVIQNDIPAAAGLLENAILQYETIAILLESRTEPMEVDELAGVASLLRLVGSTALYAFEKSDPLRVLEDEDTQAVTSLRGPV